MVLENLVIPFQINNKIKGTIVRLSSVASQIINASHPRNVKSIFADSISITASIGSRMKNDGVFSLQAHSEGIIKTIFVDLNNNSSIVSGVLAKVYLKDGKYVVNIEQNEDNIINYSRTRQFFGPVTIKKIGISILDEYGNEINLNNMDYSFTIEVSQLYSACV